MIQLFKYIVIVSFFSSLYGTISIENARNVAENFIVERFSYNKSISDVFIKSKEGKKSYYIFSLSPSGFIIVSASKNVIPILGYSFTNNLNHNNLPLQLDAVLESYEKNIHDTLTIIDSNFEIKSLWDKYESLTIRDEDLREVEPLIEAIWNQGGEWNDLCPEDALVGCVAVAMGQIMHYWGHPVSGSGYSSYYHSTYGPISVDFSNFSYNYDNMSNEYATFDSQLLLYHAGVAVNMDYSPWGSGASVCWEGPSSQAALIENFNYIEDSGCHTKINYTDDDWYNLIKDQLDNGWPVIYRAYAENDGPGHAWNVDGYQEGGYLHCNWGWGGSSNGYFYFNNLNGGGYNFVENQAALINLIPQGLETPMALYEFEINDLTVNFYDLSSSINENEIIEWMWDFGDGNISFESSPIHSYENFDEYEVSLIVTNIYGIDSIPFIEYLNIQDLTGDLNGDFYVNILDVIFLVDLILNSEEVSESNYMSDVNEDGFFTILDIINLVGIILNN